MLRPPPPPRPASALPAPAQSLWVEADGHRLEVTRLDGATPTLVFLHEGLGSVSAWRDFPRRLATVIIQGMDDEYGTLAQVDAIGRLVTGRCERLILPACGHAPHRDCPDEVLAAMTRFIGELGPAQGG